MAENRAVLQYIQDLPKYNKEKPFNLSLSTYAEKAISNVELEDRDVPLIDVRDCSNQYSYDTHSFRFLKLPTHSKFDNSEESTISYLEEMKTFLMKEFNAESVVCYDIRVRA